MSTIKIDDQTGDLAVVGNNLMLVDRADEVRQLLRSRIRTFLEEWFLDTTIGLPYHQSIFVKGTRPETVASYIKREILGCPGVLALLEYSQDFDSQNRQLTASFRVQVTDNEILTINEVVG
jgi:hypothetical protein